ncbi:MAG: ABC transporter ATP-binding protein [Actinomycetota bacterium]
MTSVIEIRGLRKTFARVRGSRTTALDGLDLDVPEGGVFGFLGPNGSGKTTTIRIMLGLVRASEGSVHVLGAQVPRDLATVIRRIGSIVEQPALFPTFTARENLDHLARIDGIGPRRIDAVLERVGLAARQRDLVKNYSLGMRQRLGIAAALLKDPALLVLDEPANGLDPAGIVEVRELLRSLGREGRTVFVSSHLLSEVRQMCDHVAILARGKAVAAGPVGEVLAGGRAARLVVRVEDLDRGADVLCGAGISAAVANGTIRVGLDPAQASRVSRTLAEHGLYVSELRTEEADLEAVFLELTKDPEAVTA